MLSKLLVHSSRLALSSTKGSLPVYGTFHSCGSLRFSGAVPKFDSLHPGGTFRRRWLTRSMWY